MIGPFRRWRRLSLRVQLLVIVAVSVLAAVGILGVTSVSYLRGSLLQSAKESATVISEGIFTKVYQADGLDDFKQLDANSMAEVSLRLRYGDFAIAVDGESFYAEYHTEEEGQVALTDQQVAQLEDIPYLGSRPIRVDIEGMGPFLVTMAPLNSSNGAAWGRLYVGVPVAEIDHIVAEFLQRETLYAVGLGLGVVAIASVAIFQALRPLRRVTAIANQVAEKPLSEGEVTLPDRVSPVDPVSNSEADQLAISFNRMLENVEAALQTREQAEKSMQRFVAEASHELRNPLAAIRGYAEYASGVSGVPAEATGALERIEMESTRLARLADELLLLARLEAGRTPTLEPVDLSLVVLETIEDSRIRWPEHIWQIDLPEEPVELVGSDDALRRVLINLTANAGVHTPAGTCVSVAVRALEDHIALTVADDGPGIPAESLPTVFDRFTQAKGGLRNVRDSGNAGLGLAIVRALMDEAGYRLWVESAPGQTVFGVEIPRTCE